MQATVPRVFATVVATDTSDVAKLSFRGPHNLGFCSLHPFFIPFSGGRTILEAQFFVISPSFFRRKYLSMLRWQNIIVYIVPDCKLSRKTRNFFRTFTTRQIKSKIFLIYFFLVSKPHSLCLFFWTLGSYLFESNRTFSKCVFLL